MTTHEERKRELAKAAMHQRATLPPEDWDSSEFDTFHDPETALLEADFMSAFRDLEEDIKLDGDVKLSWLILREKWAALDAHHAKREGK